MKAYELADDLEAMESGWATDVTLQDAAIILRQQADRIKELKKRPAVNREYRLVCAKCFKGIGE